MRPLLRRWPATWPCVAIVAVVMTAVLVVRPSAAPAWAPVEALAVVACLHLDGARPDVVDTALYVCVALIPVGAIITGVLMGGV